MGRLAVISDLHADINSFDEELALLRNYLLEEQVDHVHFAGDLANHVSQALTIVDFFTEKIPTTFHWGNHEMADIHQPEDFENFNYPAFLNFKTKDLSEDTLLLAFNGWYDYSFAPQLETKEIQRKKQIYWYDRWINRRKTDRQITDDVCQRLTQALKAIPSHKKIFVSTHFVPQSAFIVHFSNEYARWNQLNAFLGSQQIGDALAEFPNVKQVVFGHTHHRFDQKKIASAYYHCRPIGYYYEWDLTYQFTQEKNPSQARKVARRNWQEFSDYKKQNILTEFKKSVVLLDY